MNIVTIDVSQGGCSGAAPLLLGYAGEDSVEAVDFDFSAWVTAYGEGEIYLEIMRAKDTAPYLAILEVDGTVARWTISDVDTAKHGPGVAQLVYQPTGATKKSAIYKFFAGKSLTEPGGDDPWGPIIERMEEILAEVKEQATAADQSAQNAAGSAEDAEAWAVGERGGEPVPATDPTFENNAKYYADEAGETVRTFTETTAPAAVQAVNTAGQTQVQAVNTAGAAKVQDVNTAGATQVQAVNTAGQTALSAVSGAQTDAVNAITQKSTEEQAAIQQKGAEVLESIPSDYSDLSDEVDDLKSAINKLTPAATAADVGKALIVKTVDQQTGKPASYEYGETGGGGGGDTVAAKLLANIIPGTTQSVAFDANNKPATVVFAENGTAVRTDTFTWGSGTVTEVRTLSSGEYITMVTDLTTLVTTMSAIQRGE